MKKNSALLVILVAVIGLGLAAAAFGGQDDGFGLNVQPPSKTDGAVTKTPSGIPVVGVVTLGGATLPVKQDYKAIFATITANLAGGASRKINITNFIMNNYSAVHPYPAQVRIKQATAVSTASTTWRVYFYSRSTFEGTAYSLDNYLSSINFGSLTAAPNGADYVQDVQCDMPYIDLDKTRVLHVVIKNTGATSARLFLAFIYE